MSKVMGAVTDGGWHRMRLIGALVAVAVTVGLVLLVSTEPAQPTGWGHGDNRGEDKFLFFASDGLMQQSVEKYARPGRGAGVP